MIFQQTSMQYIPINTGEQQKPVKSISLELRKSTYCATEQCYRLSLL